MLPAEPKGPRDPRPARPEDASADRQDSDRLSWGQASTNSRTAALKLSRSAAGKANLGGLEKEKRKLQEKVSLIKNRIRCMQEENEKNRRQVEDFKEKKAQVVQQKIEKIAVKEAVEEARRLHADRK